MERVPGSYGMTKSHPRRSAKRSSTEHSPVTQPKTRPGAQLEQAERDHVPLSTWFTLRRRYARSVNLERDLDVTGAVRGYVVTPRASDALERIVEACLTPGTTGAFTLTGVYGTGKSAFAHFLATLVSGTKNPHKREALDALQHQASNRALAHTIGDAFGSQGMVRAVATAQREPLANTLLRAIRRGAEGLQTVPSRARKSSAAFMRSLRKCTNAHARGGPIPSDTILALIAELAEASRSGLLLVIDELGKSLEFSSHSETDSDVFLLQQLAEIPNAASGRPIVFLGLLHQAFSEYGLTLATQQRLEWEKIQGRFEDLAFGEAPEHILHLMKHAICQDGAPPLVREAMSRHGRAWHERLATELPDPYVADILRPETITTLYPLHPVAALALPVLCTRYAQYDRSLFTFLTSSEPNAFARFLREHVGHAGSLPTQRLANIYDYFVDVAGHGISMRPQFQRWAEVNAVVENGRSLGPDAHAVLKTIGALNLMTAGGPLRASRALVLAALVDTPDDQDVRPRWEQVLDALVERGVITYRDRLDEYRIWEGSDFDVSTAVRDHARIETRPLSAILQEAVPLSPMVAQRHSFETGTLRYFERRFVGRTTELTGLTCSSPDIDGLILYWVDEESPSTIPASTQDGRPVVLIKASATTSLHAAATDLAALYAVARTAVQLQSDGVARREVAQRIEYAKRRLEQAVHTAFDLHRAHCWLEGRSERLIPAAFNARLSTLCDTVYHRGPTLRNELINRRDLTSQGAKARRELIHAMLRHEKEPRLGIQGDGPEATLYETVLRLTGIHRARRHPADTEPSDTELRLGPPSSHEVTPLWQAIEDFCLESRAEPRHLGILYDRLAAPPYGVKSGVVPIILAAILSYHTDDLSVYYEGSFLPSLGPEHFELLVKNPPAFAVKHFELAGIRGEVFRQLEELVRHTHPDRLSARASRNATLLSVVKPLVRFASTLPQYTKRTSQISQKAQAVRRALLTAREPDELLFRNLPEACGLPALDAIQVEIDGGTGTFAGRLRQELLQALRELAGSYERQLERCAKVLHEAFGVADDPSRLRAHLSVRAQYLIGKVVEPGLKRFVSAAVSDVQAEREWLEGLVMIISDKPPETWTDDDAAAFEMRVGDMARRFTNVEALIHDTTATRHEGFEVRRITITRTDGSEQHHVVWVEPHAREALENLVREVIRHVDVFTDEQRRGAAATIAEALLSDATPSMIVPTTTAGPVLGVTDSGRRPKRARSSRNG